MATLILRKKCQTTLTSTLKLITEETNTKKQTITKKLIMINVQGVLLRMFRYNILGIDISGAL